MKTIPKLPKVAPLHFKQVKRKTLIDPRPSELEPTSGTHPIRRWDLAVVVVHTSRSDLPPEPFSEETVRRGLCGERLS